MYRASALAVVLVAVAGCGDRGCPVGTEDCGGECVNFGTDANCLRCGNTCTGGRFCQPEVGCSCTAGLTECGAECVDLASDDANCGRCSNNCGSAICVSGSCACPDSTHTLCGMACVDLMTAAMSCGSCGNACTAPESCFDGACSCTSGLQVCGDECRDVRGSDNENCGGCDRRCGGGATCEAGRCRCTAGLEQCSTECHDTMRDPEHCGRCGQECDVRAGHFCASGTCGPTAAWAVGLASDDSAFTFGQRNVAVAIDPADVEDRVYVAYSTLLAGGFSATVTVVALDADGMELWRRVLGTYSRDTTPAGLDVAGGRVAVAVTDQGTISSTVLLDAVDGTITDRIEPLGFATMGVAVAPDGGFIVVGLHRAGFTVGSVSIATAAWHTVFVIRFDADAEPVFGFSLGDPTVSEQRPAVGLADDGSFFVAAAGGGRSSNKDGFTFPGQGWVAGFDADGTTQWVEGAALRGALDFAVSSTRVFLLASADGPVGGMSLSTDTFVASWSLAGAGGFLLPLYPFWVDGGGIAFADARVFATVPGRDDYTLGGLRLSGSGTRDSIVAALRTNGTASWLTSVTASSSEEVQDVAATSRFVVLVGRYTGTLEASDEVSLPSMGGGSVYVVRIDR